jgi:hypothetical protein
MSERADELELKVAYTPGVTGHIDEDGNAVLCDYEDENESVTIARKHCAAVAKWLTHVAKTTRKKKP